MTTEAEKSVYPLATPSGDSIPYDVGDPDALWISDFTAAASAEKELPATWLDSICVLYASEACVVGFVDTLTLNLNVDTEKTKHLLLPKETPTSIKIPNRKFKMIGVSAAGKLYIQKFRRWQALTTETLQTRL